MKFPKISLFAPWLVLPALVLFAQVPFTACSEDNDDPETPIIETVEEIEANVTVESNVIAINYTISAKGDWTAELPSDADWLTLDKTSGTDADLDVVFTLKVNEASTSRSAVVIFTSTGVKETLTITQSASYSDGGREDVMLQAFYWDSQKETSWTKLTSSSSDIAKSFTCVWLPPSASAEGGNTVGGTNVGYHPREWNNQNSCWGTADNLKKLISTLHADGVKVIADIVINHRAGDTGWGNFTKDDFGSYGSFQLDVNHICSDDEMNDASQCSDANWYGKAAGAKDTGENWGGARDLDHTSEYVQQDCEAYLSWLKGDFGYDGWRYDFCKGYDGKYVGIYNDATEPYLSVGELWDGSYDVVDAWLEATGYKSMAFDFPMKYAALNNGLAKKKFSEMAWTNLDDNILRPAGLIHHSSTNAYSVTFVDNHDTYRDDSKYTGDVLPAYAFLLSSPGVPCVFWPHWTNKLYKTSIEDMIAARKSVGLTNISDVTVTKNSTYYEALAIGRRGSLICRIGSAAPTSTPDGYTLACKGTGWAFFTKVSE